MIGFCGTNLSNDDAAADEKEDENILCGVMGVSVVLVVVNMAFLSWAIAFVIELLGMRIDLNWDVEELEILSSEEVGKVLLLCGQFARVLP